MKSDTCFILILIGLILGFFISLIGIVQFFIFSSINQTFIKELYNSFGMDHQAMMIWNLISSIIGLFLSLVTIIYTIKINKKPTKTDYIAIIVIGAIGLVFGMGVGGALILIGGIVGVININKPGFVIKK